jgi:hypothetical protein
VVFVSLLNGCPFTALTVRLNAVNRPTTSNNAFIFLYSPNVHININDKLIS